MIIWLLKKTFAALVGKVPPEQQAIFRARFNTLLIDLTRTIAQGAIAGAINANKK